MTPIGRDLSIASRVSTQVANARGPRSEPAPYTRSNEILTKPSTDGSKVEAEYSARVIASTFREAGKYHFDHVGPAVVHRTNDFIEVHDRNDRYVKISFEGKLLDADVEHGDLEEFLSNARFATR